MASSSKTFYLNNQQQGFAEMRGVKLSLWRYLSRSTHARMKKIAFSLALQSLIVIVSAPMQQLMAYGHNIFLPDYICIGNFAAFEDQTFLTYKGSIVTTQDGKLGMYSDTEGEYVIEIDNTQGLIYDTVYVAVPGDYYGPSITDTILSTDRIFRSDYTLPELSYFYAGDGAYTQTVGNDQELKITAYNIARGYADVAIIPAQGVGGCKTIKTQGNLHLVIADAHYICSNGNAMNKPYYCQNDLPVCGCNGTTYNCPDEANINAGIARYVYGKCGEQKPIAVDTFYCTGRVLAYTWNRFAQKHLELNGKSVEDPDKLPAGKYSGFYTYWNPDELSGYLWEGSFTIGDSLPAPQLVYDTATQTIFSAKHEALMEWKTPSDTWFLFDSKVVALADHPNDCLFSGKIIDDDFYGACFSKWATIRICGTTGTFNPFPTDSICAGDTTELSAGKGYLQYKWTGLDVNTADVTVIGYGWIKVSVLDSDGEWYSDSVKLVDARNVDYFISTIKPNNPVINLDYLHNTNEKALGSGKLGLWNNHYYYFASNEDYIKGNVIIEYDSIVNRVCYPIIKNTIIVSLTKSNDNKDCFDPALINITQGLAASGDSVCGCNGTTYPNADAAQYLYGIKSVTPGACNNAAPVDKPLFMQKKICIPASAASATAVTTVTASAGYVLYFWDTDQYLAGNASASSATLAVGGHSLVVMDAQGNKFRDSIYINVSYQYPALTLTDTIGWTDTASLNKLTRPNTSIASGYSGMLLSDQPIQRYIPSAEERLAGEALLILVPTRTFPSCTTAANGTYRISIPALKIKPGTLISTHSHCIPLGRNSAQVAAYGGFQYYFWDTQTFDLAHTSAAQQTLSAGGHSLMAIDYSGYRYCDSIYLNASYQYPAPTLCDTINWADTLVLNKLTGQKTSIASGYAGMLLSDQPILRYIPSASERLAGKSILKLVPTGTFPMCTTAVEGSYTIIINALAAFKIALRSTDPATPISHDGIIWVSSISGEAPFAYLWSNGSTADRIAGLQAGTYRLTVTDKYMRTSEHSVTLAPRISKLFSIAGTVSANDVPASGAMVYAFLGPSAQMVHTDASGRFAFENVIPGNYQFMATYTGYAPSYYCQAYRWTDAFRVQADADIIGLDISLLPIVNDAKGQSAIRGRIMLADPDGNDSTFANNMLGANIPLVLIRDGKMVATSVSDPEGNYQFANIAAGNYTVIINKPGDISQAYNITVIDGTVQNIDLRAETATWIVPENSEGKIQIVPNPVSREFRIAGADERSVTLYDAFGHEMFRSGAKARYFLPELAAGVYQLQIITAGGASVSVALAVY